MNLSDIITKCYILALIIRDDGERLLLGDGFFEFKESLQHFQPNTFVNDVVELQGTDGQLLAGQVRRTAVQTFEGFIGDGTIGREQTETNRRRFLQFFRKKHFYTVVYILPDGSAVQRDRGYIVNAPSAPELYQRFPEYSVGLNFEDPNYYEYDEGEDGDEIPAHSVVLSIANLLEGGLIWDAFGAVSNEKTWLDWENGTTTDGFYTYNNGLAGAPLEFTQLDGNAAQQTYTGKNLAEVVCRTSAMQGITATYNSATGVITLSGTATTVYSTPFQPINVNIPAGTYTLKQYGTLSHGRIGVNLRRADNTQITEQLVNTSTLQNTFTLTEDAKIMQLLTGGHQANDSVSGNIQVLLVAGSTAGDFEPFVGGIPAPNPDYPQAIKTVTGAQTVKITGKNLIPSTPYRTGPGYYNGTPGADMSPTTSTYVTTSVAGDKITIACTATWVAAMFLVEVTEGQAYHLHFHQKGTGARSTTYTLDSSYKVVRNTGNAANDDYTRDGNITVESGEKYIAIAIGCGSPASTITVEQLQVELGNQATTYEPYHGQSHEINLGGNLINFAENTISSSNGLTITSSSDGTIQWTGTPTASWANITSEIAVSLPAGTYTFNIGQAFSHRIYVRTTPAYDFIIEPNQTSVTHTFTSAITAARLDLAGLSTSTNYNESVQTMFTAGTQAKPYVPYTASSYELAGVGPIQSDGLPKYHDSFKRVDGVWYKHAQIGKKTYDGTTEGNIWSRTVNGTNYSFWFRNHTMDALTARCPKLCDRFTYTNTNFDIAPTPSLCENAADYGPTAYMFIFNVPPEIAATIDEWKAWLGNNPTTVYYPLDTPTDTVITDTDLLAQLNAIASTYDGVNNITITPSAGAQGELSVHYATGSIDVGAGYEWEEGSDTGTNVVINNGIDSVNPTWIVPGPATNPTLTNITTGQTIVWEGSVASGQTLTVDLNRQTAELGGTNVFAQLSGDWVQLAPGPNKLAYSATGATEGCRLEWNGVVG